MQANCLFNIALAIIIILLAINIFLTKTTMDNTNIYFNKQRVLIQESVPIEELSIIDEEVL